MNNDRYHRPGGRLPEDRLEPDSDTVLPAEQTEYSMAVSLRRIADSLERLADTITGIRRPPPP